SKDSTRSPIVPKTPIITAISIQIHEGKMPKWVDRINPAIIANKTPPTNPSHVLFGEIRTKSLCFPRLFPARYAPVSLVHNKIKNPRGMKALYVSPKKPKLIKKIKGITAYSRPKSE